MKVNIILRGNTGLQPDQFHEGNEGKSGDSSNRHQDTEPSPKYPENQEIHVQNRIGDSSDSSDSFFSTEGGTTYSHHPYFRCYHCNNLQTDSSELLKLRNWKPKLHEILFL
jgi:hypothetical protein